MSTNEREFATGALRILVTWGRGHMSIVFMGSSDSRVRASFFESVLEELKSIHGIERVLVDFRRLEYMNSAAVGAIMRWVRAFEVMKLDTVLRFDGKVSWQRVNMLCMTAIARGLKHLRVEGS